MPTDLNTSMAADTRPISGRVSYYFIRSGHSNLILDVEIFGGKTHPAGSRVTTWLAKNWSDQLWYDDPDTGTIRWKKNGFCLDVKDDDEDGPAVVVINPYREGKTSQLWRRDGPFIRRSQQPDRVIDIASSLVPGAKVVVHPYDGRLNQKFDFVQIPGLDEPHLRRCFFITCAMNRRVLDVQQEKTAPGTNVIIYQKKKSPEKNQLWYFDDQGFIRSTLNDFVLESQYGRPLRVMPYNSMQCQEWTLVDGGILSRTGECLEISESKQYDGALVSSSKFYGTENQQWRLEFV